MSLRVLVNWDTCTTNGRCVLAAPEVFELRDDGYMYVIDENPDESLRAKLEDAVDSCPTQSLRIEG